MPAWRPLSASRAVPSVRAALAVGLLLAVAALAVVLTRSPPTVAGTNSTPVYPAVIAAKGDTRGCQPSGTLPGGTSAIRISFAANAGPKVTVEALSGGRVVTRGERDAGWGIAETVTVPVNQVPLTVPNTEICVALGPALGPVPINGAPVRITTPGGGTREAVRFRVEYLRPAHSSWWSMVSSVARRMGFGHAPGGTWIVFLLIAVMITVAVLASRLVLRELR
jgi:hypothetical protein